MPCTKSGKFQRIKTKLQQRYSMNRIFRQESNKSSSSSAPVYFSKEMGLSFDDVLKNLDVLSEPPAKKLKLSTKQPNPIFLKKKQTKPVKAKSKIAEPTKQIFVEKAYIFDETISWPKPEQKDVQITTKENKASKSIQLKSLNTNLEQPTLMSESNGNSSSASSSRLPWPKPVQKEVQVTTKETDISSKTNLEQPTLMSESNGSSTSTSSSTSSDTQRFSEEFGLMFDAVFKRIEDLINTPAVKKLKLFTLENSHISEQPKSTTEQHTLSSIKSVSMEKTKISSENLLNNAKSESTSGPSDVSKVNQKSVKVSIDLSKISLKSLQSKIQKGGTKKKPDEEIVVEKAYLFDETIPWPKASEKRPLKK